jgi:hypothetical protein
MTPEKAKEIAKAIASVLGGRLKAVHVYPKLHEGQVTAKIFLWPLRSTEVSEPEPFMFNSEELEDRNRDAS